MPIVMKFGLLPPTLNADVVDQQLRLANRYRNTLVEIERTRRDLIREAEGPAARELEGKAKELGIQLKKVNGCSTPSKSRQRQLRDVRAELRSLRDEPSLVARLFEIDGRTKKVKVEGEKLSRAKARNASKTPNNSIVAKLRRAARAASDLFWGTYLCVEDAAGRSFADCGGPYDGSENNDPKWKRWNGEGTLGVQIQKSKPLAIFEDDSRVHIDPVDLLALTSPIRSERRKASRTKLRMAVAGNARGKSEYIYAEWPMLLHRPIPDDARITWVKVSKRMVGPRVEWSCEITLERTKPMRPAPSAGTLAVVFGWRSMHGEKVRVAQWLSTTGESGVLDLSKAGNESKRSYPNGHCEKESPYGSEVDGGRGGVISGFRRVETLHGTREKNFNETRDMLVAWLRTLPEVPEWIRYKTGKYQGQIDGLKVETKDSVPSSAQALAYIGQWKSSRKLAALARTWKENRFEGDGQGFDALEAWRYHDFHLWQWEESQRKSAARRRNDVYRVTAAKLADKYGKILADGTDFKGMREKEESEIPKEQRGKAQSMSQIASPGILRDAFKNAATQRGREYEKVDVKKSAQRCPRCGAEHKAHKSTSDHMFACTECPLVRDMSTVRLMNMLRDDGHVEEVLEFIRKDEEMTERMERLGRMAAE